MAKLFVAEHNRLKHDGTLYAEGEEVPGKELDKEEAEHLLEIGTLTTQPPKDWHPDETAEVDVSDVSDDDLLQEAARRGLVELEVEAEAKADAKAEK